MRLVCGDAILGATGLRGAGAAGDGGHLDPGECGEVRPFGVGGLGWNVGGAKGREPVQQQRKQVSDVESRPLGRHGVPAAGMFIQSIRFRQCTRWFPIGPNASG